MPTVTVISALRRAFALLQTVEVGELTPAESLTYLTLAALSTTHYAENPEGWFSAYSIADTSRQTVERAKTHLESLVKARLVRRSPRVTKGSTTMLTTYQLRWDR